MGPVDSYPAGGALVLVSGSLRMNRETLSAMGRSLDAHRTRAADSHRPAADDLLERKLRSLKAHGSVLCSQENAPLLRALLQEQLDATEVGARGVSGHGAVTDHRQYVSPIQPRQETVLQRASDRFDRGVSASEIEQGLEGLRCSDTVVAPVRAARRAGSQVRPGERSGAVL